MSRRLLIAILTGLFLALIPSTAIAEGIEEGSIPLCPPDIFYFSTQDCMPLGPTAYLLDMAEIGITFPETPLPIQNPDPSLADLEYKYAYVVSDNAPIFPTLDDVIDNNKGKIVRRIKPGFNYVSVSQTVYRQGKYYHYTDVGWMFGSDLALTDVPLFQGVEFTETPKQDFGWILSMFAAGGKAETKPTPGYDKED